ncbi:MAG TPA: alpha/beta fold hydrolase [Acidimicrobiales bacterium]|nr:alpha/beta fold hydrolase [Acidimicrobiales bacterium]
MARARTNGIELEYDSFGAASDPALLLISGFATQLIGWEPEFCRLLADEGFYVVRFDNRDVGLSSRIDADVDLDALLAGALRSVPYGLEDMADDAAGLLDALGREAAHIVGSSMGGMIGQTLAIRHPTRVLSLCSIMSTTGDPTVGQSTSEAMTALMTPAAASPAAAASRGVEVGRVMSPGKYFDEDRAARRAREAYVRAHGPGGAVRQLAAVGTQVDRTEALAGVRVPTLAIHGALDPVFHVSGGEATARAVPGARLLRIEDMGHDIPEPLWPLIVSEIVTNARRATAGG